MKELRKQRFALIALVLSLLMVVGLVAGCDSDPGSATEDTKETVGAPAKSDDYALYWNIDRDKYYGMGDDGISTGRAKGESGNYEISMITDEGVVTVKAPKKSLATKIDEQYLMCLAFDENGLVTDVLDIYDVVPEVYTNQYYVTSASKDKIVTNTSATYKGMVFEFALSDSTKIINCSAIGTQGVVDSLRKNDRVTTIKNTKGDVTHVFITQRDEESLVQMCPHCNSEVRFSAWMDTRSLPTANSGHYYLVNDVQLNAQQSIAADVKVTLDLNGKTVNGLQKSRIYSVHNKGARLDIMDLSEAQTGKLVGLGECDDQGTCVWVRYGEFTLWSGTLDASQVNNTLGGACVDAREGTTFTMKGGKLIGGTVTGANGGCVRSEGTLVIEGGLMEGGNAVSTTVDGNVKGGYGGCIYIDSGSLILNGGEIKGGTAQFGTSTLYISLDSGIEFKNNGTTITGDDNSEDLPKPPAPEMRYCPHCKAETIFTPWFNTKAMPCGSQDGHFYLVNDIQLNIQAQPGENSECIVDLNGRTVTGKANLRVIAMWGENAYLAIMDSSAAQTGKLVAHGNDMDQGLCVWAGYGKNMTFEMFSGTLDGSQATSDMWGTTVTVTGTNTFNFHGGKILGGVAKGRFVDSAYSGGYGGAVHVSGTVNMYGGEIIGGKAETIMNAGQVMSGGQGGCLYLSGNGVFNMEGGTISGGEAELEGDSVFVGANATFNKGANATVEGEIYKQPAA